MVWSVRGRRKSWLKCKTSETSQDTSDHTQSSVCLLERSSMKTPSKDELCLRLHLPGFRWRRTLHGGDVKSYAGNMVYNSLSNGRRATLLGNPITSLDKPGQKVEPLVEYRRFHSVTV